ncbi:MAG: TVP38/TMEM64 family protein [Alphaproteobacteria bacterium CG1_02_46_17]|nr:MAG: TVP38/TMEM64 family protein [Alphaproteobacteria bacterium CG1_02_46_17]
MNKTIIKAVIALALAGIFIAIWLLDLSQYLTLENMRTQQAALKDFQAAQSFIVSGIFFLAYVAVAALSLPGAVIMTLLGGALFGFWQGLVVVSFASTIGATLAFLLARFLFRDWIQGRYQKPLTTLNEGFKNEGVFYLFALRLIPVFPFFLVNILTSVMPIKTRHFYGASQLGMLPGTAVYVYAGTELGKLQSLSDIASPPMLAAFVLLGLFPIIAKKIIATIRGRRRK